MRKDHLEEIISEHNKLDEGHVLIYWGYIRSKNIYTSRRKKDLPSYYTYRGKDYHLLIIHASTIGKKDKTLKKLAWCYVPSCNHIHGIGASALYYKQQQRRKKRQ